MGIPHIPIELIHEILGNLPTEKRTLESCSLVCKAWVHPSRSYLFSEVVLDDYRVKRLLAFGRLSTVIIPHILSLHLKRFGRTVWNDIIPDLVGFQRVRSLTLERLSSCYLSAQTQSTFFTQFTGVVRLRVLGSTEISGPQLADTICSFPRLEALDLGHMGLKWPTPLSGEELASSPRTISRHLHTLDIYRSDITMILSWILSFVNPPKLHTLYLHWHSGTFGYFNNLLPHLRFLERLLLSIDDSEYNPDEFIDLSHQERLRSLHIMGMDPDKCLVQTLASITSACMDELIFDLYIYQRATDDLEWKEMDAVLQSPQFLNLRTVQFNVPLCPVLDARLPSLLSRCHGRGILSVRSFDEVYQ